MRLQLHITRVPLNRLCVIYRWACRTEFDDIAFDTANSIESCLIAAVAIPMCLDGKVAIIEILYRKVALGSFPVTLLDSCTAEVADLIMERYEQTRAYN